LKGIDLLPHRPRVADDAARPFQHAFAFRREPAEARSALHQHDAENVFQLLDARRQRGLADAACLGGTTEMALARERNDEFKLVDHDCKSEDALSEIMPAHSHLQR
jgi:hypothetical protein